MLLFDGDNTKLIENSSSLQTLPLWTWTKQPTPIFTVLWGVAATTLASSHDLISRLLAKDTCGEAQPRTISLPTHLYSTPSKISPIKLRKIPMLHWLRHSPTLKANILLATTTSTLSRSWILRSFMNLQPSRILRQQCAYQMLQIWHKSWTIWTPEDFGNQMLVSYRSTWTNTTNREL